MESEEYEHIPWSNLVTQTEPTVDRRLYIAGAAVGVVVIMFLASRLFGSTAPQLAAPLPETVPPAVSPVEVDAPSTPVTPPSEPIGSVSEADLMADAGESSVANIDVPVLIAEWFVTDFFTRDGSPETLASLEAAVATDELAADLPHHDEDASTAFVEWARVFDLNESDDSIQVSVAYRSVHAEEGGFVRDPVQAVELTLTETAQGWRVSQLPSAIPLPR